MIARSGRSQCCHGTWLLLPHRKRQGRRPISTRQFPSRKSSRPICLSLFGNAAYVGHARLGASLRFLLGRPCPPPASSFLSPSPLPSDHCDSGRLVAFPGGNVATSTCARNWVARRYIPRSFIFFAQLRKSKLCAGDSRSYLRSMSSSGACGYVLFSGQGWNTRSLVLGNWILLRSGW